MDQNTDGALRVEDLYAPEMLTVVVGKAAREFTVPRGLICSKSAYFEKAFQRGFKEGQEARITLKDVKEWIFECFIGWLYTHRVAWAPSPERVDSAGPKSIEGAAAESESGDENLRHDPITWSWWYLTNMYLFADEYDTKQLRNALMILIQIKGLQKKPRIYLWPSKQTLADAFSRVPESSKFFKFWEDVVVHSLNPGQVSLSEDWTILPRNVLARLLVRAVQLTRLSNCRICPGKGSCSSDSHVDLKCGTWPLLEDPCTYHEHDTEEERKLCAVVWKDLLKKHR